jgi:hypothetical protein
LSLYFGRKNPEPMLFNLGKILTCIGTGTDSDGVQRTMFGTAEGYVYQLDIGSSFDGDPYDSFIKMPFEHCGGPRVLKKFDKVILETVPSPETTIGMTYEYDFADGEQPSAAITDIMIIGGGGDWNTVDWNTIQWSAPLNGEAEFFIEGQGRTLALTFVCSSDEQRSHVLQTASLLYRPKGQKR